MDRENALKALDSLIEDLHNAIVIEPVGLKLSMGQCIDLYVKMKHVRALTEAPKVDVEGLKEAMNKYFYNDQFPEEYERGHTDGIENAVYYLTTHYDLVKKEG